MSFDDQDEDNHTPIRKIGLKKTNSAPIQNNAEMKANFEQQANAQHDRIEEYKSEMWDLSIKYKSFIESKVLPENKGPIASNLEKEVLDKLVGLASNMNEDKFQPESIGSTALCMLLLKCMLLQRDTINILSFKLDQIDKKTPTKG